MIAALSKYHADPTKQDKSGHVPADYAEGPVVRLSLSLSVSCFLVDYFLARVWFCHFLVALTFVNTCV